VRGELDALGFAAGERGGGLAEADVAEADLVEDVELVDDLRDGRRSRQGFLDGHVEDVVDVLALVLDVEDGGFVTGSVAFFAGELDVGEELHLDGDGAVAFADVAAAAGDVEGEAAGGEALALGVGLRGEEGADVVEGFDICNRIGSRGAADGGLVDEDDVVEVLGAGEIADRGARSGSLPSVWPSACMQRAVEDLVDDGGFARAGDAGDAAEQVERDVESTPRRLWMRAPVSLRCSRPGSRRCFGMGMVRRPERYLPVMELGLAVTSATVPAASSWPPSSPAPGPRSSR
jgi:hypothetical protein